LKIVKVILFWFLIVILIIPVIQKEIPFVSIGKLGGDFVTAEKPTLNCGSWFSGELQIKSDRFIEQNMGFRNFLVRLNNQIDFLLFRKPHAEGVVLGKQNYMFEYDYLRAYAGGDFIGEKIIDYKIRKLKFLQEYLKTEKNIDLVLVFEPSKSAFYPEFIPDKYLAEKSETTNYKVFKDKAKEHDVRFIDFKTYYNSLKGKTPYPLYTHYGIHWSEYGMSFVADSMLKYIEGVRNIDMNDSQIDSLVVQTVPNSADYDVGVVLNLLCQLPEKEPLAYPVYRFENNPDKDKPMVLVIGDSYYWNIYNTRIPLNCFKNEAFWYFYAQVYPDNYVNPLWVKDLNLKAEIEKQNIIFLMVTDRFLYKFGWNFIEEAWAIYGPVSRLDILHNKKCEVLNYSKWFDSEILKAKEWNMTLEETLDLDGEYLYSQSNMNEMLTLFGPAYYERLIRRDNKWFHSLEVKAAENHVLVEEIVRQDAIYQLQTNNKVAFDNYMKISSAKETILHDSILITETRELARKYYLTIEEGLEVKAEQITGLVPGY
jgi:hypothetical protein